MPILTTRYYSGVVQLLFRRPVRKAPIEPSVSLLISAYNEAVVIAAKVRNSLVLDYPPDQLKIVVASDGSTDATAQIVRSLITQEGKGGVRLLEFAENRGKVAALNDAVPQLRGEIVIFSDTSSMPPKDSLRKLIANFADEEVGAVSGVYAGPPRGLLLEVRNLFEHPGSQNWTLMRAHGSLYAMRKSLYPFPPPSTINDDFVIPTAVLRRGFRIAYEPPGSGLRRGP